MAIRVAQNRDNLINTGNRNLIPFEEFMNMKMRKGK